MTFQDDLNRLATEAARRHGLPDGFTVEVDTTPITAAVPTTFFMNSSHPVPPPEPVIKVNRIVGYVPASLDVLVDSGAISEAEARERGWTPPPRPPWHRRARWRWQEWRERAGRRVGGRIAGMDLTERDED